MGNEGESIMTEYWLDDWANRIDLTLDHTRVDEDQTDYELAIVLASGTGITGIDTTPVFDELTTTSSGVIDSYTKLLLQSSGDSSSSSHPIGLVGNTYVDSEAPTGLNYSYRLDGTGDYIVVSGTQSDWNFGSGNFTIDLWVYFNSFNLIDAFDTLVWRGTDSSVSFYLNHSAITNKLLFQGYQGGTTSANVTIEKDWNPSILTWYHIAVVRTGNTFMLFVNGIPLGYPVTGSGAIDSVAENLEIGRRPDVSDDRYFDGNITELRVSKGISRWTNNFNTPQNSYPNYRDVISYEDQKFAVTTVVSGIEQQLNVEKEDWNPYIEKATLWTKVPTVYSGIDTTLYLYYDSTKPDNTVYVGDVGSSIARSVWDNYTAVHHLSQNVDGGSNTIYDSTSNYHHGTPTNMEGEEGVVSELGKGVDLDGTDDYVSVSDSTDWYFGTGDFTLEGYIKFDDISKKNTILAQYINDNNVWRWMWSDTTGMWIYARDTSVTRVNATTNNIAGFNTTDYRYIAVTRNGTSFTFWHNTGQEALKSSSGNFANHAITLGVGQQAQSGSNYFDGVMDETRIIKGTALPDSRLKANYYNMSNSLITFSAPYARPTFVFTGYVNVYGSPAARTVYLYRRNTGDFVNSATSDAITGYFEVSGAYNEYHFVVVLPELDEGFNLLSYDQIDPEN